MTAKIYTASNGLFGLNFHAYIVYDADGDLNTVNDQQILGGHPDIQHFEGGPSGPIVVEAGFNNTNSLDGLGTDTPQDRNFTEINLNGQTASSVWTTMMAHASALQGAASQTDSTGALITDFQYETLGRNSNSVAATLLNAAGINFEENEPNGGITLNFPGAGNVLDASTNDVLTAFSYNNGAYTFHDNAGNDYLIIENGATADVTKDSDATTWNNIVLSGYSSLNDLWLAQEGNDLEVRDAPGFLFNDVVGIEDHFDTNGGFNTKYLFVVDGDVTADHINTGNDTISGTGITVLKQIDTQLLADYNLTGSIKIANIWTPLFGAPDITASSDADYILGDDQNSVLNGNGGSDVIYGGAGDDVLTIDGSDSQQYSYADGGSGFDYFQASSSDVILNTNSISSEAGLAENVEGIRLGVAGNNYYHVETVGWSFDMNQASAPTIDYSAINQSLNFDIDAALWTVSETVGSNPASDTYTNHSNFNNIINYSQPKFIGTNHGDTFNIDSSYAANTTQRYYLGTGDDTVTFENAIMVRKTLFFYSGGDDVISFNTPAANTSAFNSAQIRFDPSIQASDISFSKLNYTTTPISGVAENIFYDLQITVSGKGTLTFEDVRGEHRAGVDNTMGTADDVWIMGVPRLVLHDGAGEFWRTTENFDFSQFGTFNPLDPNTFTFNPLNGGTGNDTLTGTANNDVMEGLSGNDVINGQDGDDNLRGSGGNDTLNGGEGRDDLYGGLGADILNGGAENDDLFGNQGNDELNGGAGNDYLDGENEDDILNGGVGNDTLRGGYGNDEYIFNVGDGQDLITDFGGTSDLIRLGAGITLNNLTFEQGGDQLFITFSGTPTDSLQIADFYDSEKTNQLESIIFDDASSFDLTNNLGSDDSDTLNGSVAAEYLIGLDDDDTLTGAGGNDVLDGGNGADTANYSSAVAGIVSNLHTGSTSNDGDGGVDTLISIENITGSANADIITGSDGANVITTGDGGDIVQGRAGDDMITGGIGADILYGGNDNDTIYAGAGNDSDVRGENGNDTLFGEAGNDTLRGGAGNDTLDGGDDNDTLIGNDGDDTFVASAGDDVIDGGAGVDTLDYSSWGQGVTANLFSGAINEDGISGTDDNAIGIENFIGSEFADTITGNDAVNTINAGGGNDLIYARDDDDILYGDDGDDVIWAVGGDDIISGGSGSDTLRGQAGADTFMFMSGETGVDTIEDFSTAQSDVLNIADILVGYDPLVDAITDFVQITDSGSNSVVSVDANGGADNFVQIATLLNITGLTDEAALESNGTLVTV